MYPRPIPCALSLLALCFGGLALPARAQSILPGDSRAVATVTTLSGAVSVLRDGQPWALQMGDTVQMKQVIVSGVDGYALLSVADGSTFEVFANSTVTFRNNPGNWKDLADLWIGRIRVHIQHLTGQPNPNRVRTPTAVIAVRGTVFDVNVADEDGTTEVSVEEGEVEVQHAQLPYGKPRIVHPGETLVVFKNEPLARSGADRLAIFRWITNALADASRTSIAGGRGGVRIPGGTGGGTVGGAPNGSTGPGAPGSGSGPPPPKPR